MAAPTTAAEPAPGKSATTSASPPKDSAAAHAAREKLLLAGTRLVAERGIDGVNTNVIARGARVGVGTFYNHFEDKHVFHRAVIARGLELVRAALADAHRRVHDRPIPEQVLSSVAALVDVARAQPDLFKATFSRTAGGRRGASLGLSPRPVEQRLRALQREGVVDPAIDASVAARAFTEMEVSSVCWWLDEPSGPTREVLIETLMKLHPAIACQSQ